MKQILMCLETNERSNTDYVYITCTLERFYEHTKTIKYKPIYLESKSKYQDRKKQKEINNAKRAYSGETAVIYFIDMDEYSVRPEDKKLLDQIKDYCIEKGYDLVFFNKDIEDVYWRQQIPNTEKVEKAAQFRAKRIINNISIDAVSSTTISRHQSNILRILDKYWTRKVI